jgi:lysophospholipase L1-like esterase
MCIRDSSYTIGESVNENERFPVQLVNRLNKEGILTDSAIIIARTGWTTDELTAGIKNSGMNGKFDLVTLLIGVNNQYRGRDTGQYRLQFRELLQTAVQFAGNDETKVIVVSIPDYGVTPFGKANEKKIAQEIDLFNEINRQETLSRKANYVYITSISRVAKEDPSLIAQDGLHPSGKMYALWVENIFPVAKIILSD